MLYWHDNCVKLKAVSFQTSLFNDLYALCLEDGHEIDRIDPEEFLCLSSLPVGIGYINLVTRDTDLRKSVSQMMDDMHAQRFSYMHPTSASIGNVKPGVMIGSHTSICSQTTVEHDVIIMGHTSIGHNSRVGPGTIMSPSVVVSGSVEIGSFCYLHTRATVLDHVSIADGVDLGAGSMIRKNITESGHYLVNSRGTLVKL